MLDQLIVEILKAFSFLVFMLPRPIQAALGAAIGWFWFDLLRVRRKTAIDNVRRAYPELGLQAATRRARISLRHMGYNIIEVFSFPFLNEQRVESQFEYQGFEKLDAAFAKGKGVFLLSAHIGNGDLALTALAYRGYRPNLISKVFETRWLNKYWFQAREKHGAKLIPPRRSTQDILKALKNNEMVIFVLDQYTGPPNGMVTEFFGIKTGTAFGLALLAERSGAVVVPAFTYRKAFGDNVLVVQDPLTFEPQGTKEETLRHNTQKYCDAVEKMVRQVPDQWMWVHRRWKPAWEVDESGQTHLLPENSTWRPTHGTSTQNMEV